MLETLTILPWWGYALIFTLLWPIHNEANRHFQVDGLSLMIWRSFFSVLLLIPLLIISPWPTQPEFYLFCIGSGLLFSYQEAEAFKLARLHGGLFLSLQAVVWVLTATIVWWVIEPSSFFTILDEPLAAVAIVIGLGCGLGAQFVLRTRSLPEVGGALNNIVLLAMVGGLAVVGGKLAMSHTETLASMFVCSALMNTTKATAGFARLRWETRRTGLQGFFDLKVIRAGFFIGAVLAVAGPVITLALAKAPNPGFANIVTRLQDVWLYAYCRLTHRPIGMHVLGLVLSVLGVIAIVIGTQIIK